MPANFVTNHNPDAKDQVDALFVYHAPHSDKAKIKIKLILRQIKGG